MTDKATVEGRRGKGRVVAFALSAAAILLFALAPILSAMLAGLIARTNGCALDEGGVHPCLIGGTDYGETLSVMFVSGWFGLITLPIGALAAIVWCIVLAIVVVMNIRDRKS
jgi:hypothetical protein